MTRSWNNSMPATGWWDSKTEPVRPEFDRVRDLIYSINQKVIVLQTRNGPAIAVEPGTITFTPDHDATGTLYPVMAIVAGCPIDSLGDDSFRSDWNIRYAAVGGSMANGISSVELVTALARSGMIGFYGAAGQDPATVETALHALARQCGGLPWGVNLIHSPQEPDLENRLVDLYLRHHIRRIEASAYMTITPALVRYRLHGIHRSPSGAVMVPNRILAKASRVEIARKFFSPAPEPIIRHLMSEGFLTEEQARMAESVPVAGDLTAEADSGGHTDNRPLVTLLPSFQAVARECMESFAYSEPLRVGAGGGMGTPASVAAAFAMGAGWIVVGSIAQAAWESGTSEIVRRMLAEVEQAEIAMAPAADMFELGVNLQVLKRGTLFPMRAKKLYDLYRQYDGLESLPAPERAGLEKSVFQAPLEQIWEETRAFWSRRDPAQVERAERDPKHRMALVFRWYLGLSSRWANTGDPARKLDFQVWCGPSMGAFNQWVRGSFLEDPDRRNIDVIMMNLLWGACVLHRLGNLGRALPADMIRRIRDVRPMPMQPLQDLIEPSEVQP